MPKYTMPKVPQPNWDIVIIFARDGGMKLTLSNCDIAESVQTHPAVIKMSYDADDDTYFCVLSERYEVSQFAAWLMRFALENKLNMKRRYVFIGEGLRVIPPED